MSHLTTIPAAVPLRVLAADSTSMTTQLLVDALGRNPQFQMIESQSSALGILSLIETEKPEVAVISAQLEEPGLRNFDLVREIRTQSPGTRVIVLLDSSERVSVTEAFRAGARGVFCRTEPFHLLAKCIQCVADGQVWAGSSELQFVLAALAQPSLNRTMTLEDGVLSARETDVVQCVAEGLTNREIAQRLKLTEHTVKNYLFRIFDKLGVSRRVEVLLYAFRNGSPLHLHGSRRLTRSVAALPAAMAGEPPTLSKIAT